MKYFKFAIIILTLSLFVSVCGCSGPDQDTGSTTLGTAPVQRPTSGPYSAQASGTAATAGKPQNTSGTTTTP